jgi:hypothetical protein
VKNVENSIIFAGPKESQEWVVGIIVLGVREIHVTKKAIDKFFFLSFLDPAIVMVGF